MKIGHVRQSRGCGTLLVSAIALAAGLAIPVLAQDGKPVQTTQPALVGEPLIGGRDLRTQPTLYVVAYAHLDTQWRWTYIDTIREYIPSTLHDNFRLMDKYPGYVFNFSGSRRYKFMEEYYPQDFKRLKDYVAKGRWFPCGSSVDENDANVPSGESFIRQVLYGNEYFRKQFGVASEEFMLPDCFGFPASMPTLLAHCGLKGFSTQKLTWNAVVPIPFKVGLWEGPDGSRLAAALDPGAYVGEVRENLATSNAWEQRIKANGERSGVLADYHYYGTGDTGGAPTERSVQEVEKALSTDGPIRVVAGTADELFKDLTPVLRESLPVYKGELMLTEHSAGSVTSQAYMKRWNRKNELLAHGAELASAAAWATGALPYPSLDLEEAWYLVLGSQMHDILPGTSVPLAYDLSWNDEVLAGNLFAGAMADAVGALAASLDTWGDGQPLVLFNPVSTEREDVVEVTVPMGLAGNDAGAVTVVGSEGTPVPAQVLGQVDEGVRVAFLARVPAASLSVYRVRLGQGVMHLSSELKVSERTLENARYIVTLNDTGDVASIRDKSLNMDVLSAPIRMALHHENPAQWPAWNQDWSDRQMPPRAFAGDDGVVTIRVVERGPARVTLETTRQAEGSTFVQRISLASGGAGDRVEFENIIDWRSRERSLRVHFPLSVSNPIATFDLAAGAIERGNGHEKQYEHGFHQWANLTDTSGSSGVTMMCDSKYGCDKPDDRTLRLTLLHTPGTRGGYADQGTQDLGRHHVRFAIASHHGTWQRSETPAQAARHNSPIVSFLARTHAGDDGASKQLARLSSPDVSIMAIKKAENSDEIIVRLREHTGSPSSDVRLALWGPIVAAREVDGQERAIGTASIEGGELVTDVRGFGLRAFALTLDTKAPLATGTPLALAFDADVVSDNAARSNGAMDSSGRTFPAEQLPEEIVSGGVRFSLARHALGAPNALSCKGQAIALPSGTTRVHILAASAERDTHAHLRTGQTTHSVSIPSWRGYIGQWDKRIWPSEGGRSEIVGLEPGYVKQCDVAWFATHHHTRETEQGDALYEFCYLFSNTIDVPEGERTLTLPDDPSIKVFAITADTRAHTLGLRPAAPMFDTLRDHVQDAPRIEPRGGSFDDATVVRLLPNTYFKADAVRYTLDGSAPKATSGVYSGEIVLHEPATLRAAVLGRDGRLSEEVRADFAVRDISAPRVLEIESVFRSPTLRVRFSEPISRGALDAARYAIEPPLGVQGVTLSPDGRVATLSLARAPDLDVQHTLTLTGVHDRAGNQVEQTPVSFVAAGPVYRMPELTDALRGQTIEVEGLPVGARDAWTMNTFVRLDEQMPNRTIIAGFGRCKDGREGAARYLAKFAGGAHFWSSNQDVPSKTQLDVGRWQMLSATFDGLTLRMYKDGVEIAKGKPGLLDEEGVVSIAPIDPWEGQRRFEGQLREFTIWRGALGQDALLALLAQAPAE